MFLLIDISMKVVFGMFFLFFSNTDVQFTKIKLTCKTYITKEALLTT